MLSVLSMATQNEAPPALQPVQAPAEQQRPLLLEGYIQECEGYLERKTKILKRWKKEYFKVAPGNLKVCDHVQYVLYLMLVCWDTMED